MKSMRVAVWAVGLAASSVGGSAWALTPAGTAFTYQGQLKLSGVPADGLYDFQFSLWNDSRSTDPRDQIGSTLTLREEPVADGLFTVPLDFGPGAFDGDARFLDIAVRRTGGVGYETLKPRQEVTPTPYSMMALEAVGVDGHSLDAEDGVPADAVFVDKDGNVGVGRTDPRSALDVDGTLTTAGFKLTLTPTAGHVLTSDASGIGTWQPAGGGGSSYWSIDPNDNIYYGNGNVGVGMGAMDTPLYPLHVLGTAAMSSLKLGDSATVGHVLTTDADGFGTWQAPPGGGFCPWDDGPDDHIYYNDGNVGIGTGSGQTPVQELHVEGSAYVRDRVGIGTTTPDYPLHVVAVTGDAIVGQTTVGTGATSGLHGEVASSIGNGVKGVATGNGGRGVYGIADNGTGVEGYSARSDTYAVYGFNEAGTGDAVGIQGETGSPVGRGVVGRASSGDPGPACGVYGDADGPDGRGVCGVAAGDDAFAGYFVGRGYFSGPVGIGTAGPFVPGDDSVGVMSATLPSVQHGHSCAANSITGKIYCFGGTDGTNHFDRIVEYDPDSDTLVTKVATLPSGMESLSCAETPSSGKIYCFGGGNYDSRFDEIVEYIPSTDTLSVKSATLPTLTSGLSCAGSSATGKIYCFGGYDGDNLDRVVEYNPVMDTLVTKSATLPSAGLGFACTGDPATGKIYCFGGATSTMYHTEIHEYDPGTDSLVTLSNVLPAPRTEMACVADPTTGNICCFGGREYAAKVDDIYELDPGTGKLQTRPVTLPERRGDMGCAADPATGKIYCLGGNGGGNTRYDDIVVYRRHSETLLQVGNPSDGRGAVSSAWSVFSSRAYKSDITPIGAADYQEILEKLSATDVVRYRYTDDEGRTRHMGVIAEDSPAEILVPGGKAISLGDYATFLMAAIKAQQTVIEEKDCQLADIQERLNRLEALLLESTSTEKGDK